MKIQRNIIYLLFIGLGITTILYACCIFKWNTQGCVIEDKWKEFVSNLLVGIWGSAFVSLLISVIGYLNERKIVLRNYYKNWLILIEHCGEYLNYTDKAIWYKEYERKFHDFFDFGEEIAFFIDIRKHKKYLGEIVNFYNIFIILMQDDFKILNCALDKSTVENKIEETMLKKRTINKLNQDMTVDIMNFKKIYNIGVKGLFTKYRFNKTILTEASFKEVSQGVEENIKEIIKKMQKNGSTKVTIRISKSNVKVLEKKQYIYRATQLEGDYYELECRFILVHYFELKDSLKKEMLLV